MKFSVKRVGISLVELLTVIAIIAVVSVLTMMALQQARESARTVSCKSKLTQIGKAFLNVEASTKELPGPFFLAHALPFMELENEMEKMQAKEFRTPIAALVCPSDNAPKFEHSLYLNYLGNMGVTSTQKGPDGVFGFEDQGIQLRDIRDGLSSTAMLSEALTGTPSQSSDSFRLRVVWKTPGEPYSVEQLDELRKVCQSIPADPLAAGWHGEWQLRGGFYSLDDQALITGTAATFYNHSLGPQNAGCSNGGSFFNAIIPPTSNHSSVVNLVFCDGHIESISNDIDIVAWQSLGDRNGAAK